MNPMKHRLLHSGIEDVLHQFTTNFFFQRHEGEMTMTFFMQYVIRTNQMVKTGPAK